jgi:hypothetical protein
MLPIVGVISVAPHGSVTNAVRGLAICSVDAEELRFGIEGTKSGPSTFFPARRKRVRRLAGVTYSSFRSASSATWHRWDPSKQRCTPVAPGVHGKSPSWRSGSFSSSVGSSWPPIVAWISRAVVGRVPEG